MTFGNPLILKHQGAELHNYRVMRGKGENQPLILTDLDKQSE